MKLGVWNRLAIVLAALALLIAPIAVWFAVAINMGKARNAAYDLCMSYAHAALEREERDLYRSISDGCWDELFKSGNQNPGWGLWFEALLTTAVICALIYLLVWGIAATCRWVLRPLHDITK